MFWPNFFIYFSPWYFETPIFTCYHRHGRITMLWSHKPIHYSILLIPLLVRVRGLFAKAVIELLKELEALSGHRAAAVCAEKRVDEHTGGRKTGGGGRRGRRRGDFGRRSHGPVVLGCQSQHVAESGAGLRHIERGAAKFAPLGRPAL